MIRPDAFIDAAGERGFRLYAGVPCSFLKPFIDYTIGAVSLHYVGAANEGDAVAIAAGAELGGTRSVAMFQNSGLGNAVNPLTSLCWPFRIPVLLIPTLRADPDGPPDEPQHRLMGGATTRMLDLMEIPWELFPTGAAEIGPALDRALEHMERERRPYALVMRQGSVEAWRGAPRAEPRPIEGRAPERDARAPATSRSEMLRAIQGATREDDVLLATTGYTGRELHALDDRASQLYMVGSMGCVSSLALGLALARPERRVIAIDGDGAALMRLGALATIGYERPANLVHVLLDNGQHESTGGQATVSHSIDFCAIAAACGYPRCERARLPAELAACVAAAGSELAFVHVPIRPGVPAGLPRPELQPHEVASRLRAFLEVD